MDTPQETNESLSQFGKLLADLAKAGVDFAVAGGLAVIFNGYARFTLDADIIVSDTPENLDLLLSILRQWGEGWAKELSPADFPPEEGAVRIVEEFELDVFTRLRTRTLDEFRARLCYLSYAGARIPFLSPQDLIFCKQDSVREKDRLDVAALAEIIRQTKKD